MSSQQPFYITTPIYYVNGKPHIGHAYTTIAADAISRWHRIKGREVFFLTGTDEHGLKVLRTAESRGMTPKEHCDDMVTHWKAMWDKLDIRFDRFIRTTDADHVAVVQAVLQKLWDEDWIYQDEYTGWYSMAAERFWTEKDLVDGKCPDTGQPVEQISESNYFFKMGRLQQKLIDHIEANPTFIRPESRRNEVLGFLRRDLGDLCISRHKSRMSWGIEIPFDNEFVTYVWFDALLNYLTGIGFHPTAGDDWKKWWPADFHLIGKDILTTHSVYWSTMLFALDVDVASAIFAHGWWTSVDGEKMSKSLGNAIDVELLVDEFGPDATRYFFLREKSFAGDGGFSYEGFLTRYNADLANDLGNLAHRGLSMTRNWLGGVVPPLNALTDEERNLQALAATALRGFDEHMEELSYNKALEALWELVKAGNKYIDTTQPWALNRQGNTERLQTVKRIVLEVCYVAATALLPIMPNRAAELLRRLACTSAQAVADLPNLFEQAAAGSLALSSLAEGAALDVNEPLFPRFRELPERIAALFDTPAPAAKKKQAKQPKKAKKEKTKAAPAPEADGFIVYDDFAKVKLRAGRILSAEGHPNADRLLVLQVDVGEDSPRTIVAGIASRYSPEDLVNQPCVVVANLKPVKLRGVVSQGMLLAAGGKQVVGLVSVDAEPGTIVR